MILLTIVILLFVGYGLLMLYYWQSWLRMPTYTVGNTRVTGITVSIIIAARNEEQNIRSLLDSLLNQSYPKSLTEIIVVDDDSEDRTAGIVSEYKGVLLLQLKNKGINSYKKRAIEAGVAVARGELIITTDADCIAAKDWLQTIIAFKAETHSVLVAAPVSFTGEHMTDNKLLLYFQQLDFLVLQGITGASLYRQLLNMCNGANLAYEKQAFNQVNGFQGIDQLASGDDMLLMHKIKQQFPDGVHYIKSKDAIMYTQPARTWKKFLNQRIRWASKANKYDDRKIFWVLLFVYIFNLSFLGLGIAGFWNHVYWIWLMGCWLAKTIIEFPFVYSVASFFEKRWLMKFFFFFQPLHVIYTIVAGWLGQVGKYEWKGRMVK